MHIRNLAEGSLDIVGDIHGEISALKSLLRRLGYDLNGIHPEGRKLVFVGDLCDRGEDSVGVVKLVMQMVKNGNAQCILGNHELNILNNDPKDGAGWFFEERLESDRSRYPSFTVATEEERKEILEFFSTLPIALERDDLRVVHAAWHQESIERIRGCTDEIESIYQKADKTIREELASSGLLERAKSESRCWDLETKRDHQPMLFNLAEKDVKKQMGNPVRVLTSGIESIAAEPFFASHKYRFTQREPWWNSYDDQPFVVVGHFWRDYLETPAEEKGKGGRDIFEGYKNFDLLGPQQNVFCVDYSVGARYRERVRKERGNNVADGSKFRLAALSWPEKTLITDYGEQHYL